MSRKSLVVLGLVLLAACAEPPIGPSLSNSGQVTPPPPPHQTCQVTPNPQTPAYPLAAQAKKCVPIE